jgi:pimeloyl-ACP methyl ester carboxylesterase
MNVPHPALFRRALRTRAQLARSWYVFFFQLPWLPETALTRKDGESLARAIRDMAIDKSNFSDKDLAFYRQAAVDPGALTAMINYYRANFGGLMMRKVSVPYVLPIDVPTLMIWGERDSALGKELTYGTEQYVRKLTIRYLPNVSHWVQQEAPAAVNAMLGTYLDGLRVPSCDELNRAA